MMPRAMPRVRLGMVYGRPMMNNRTLSELVNEKRGISPEMAVRLSKVFGGSAESWLVQQAQYDLAHVRTGRLKLKRLELA
jgi:antitoxin HigA-1